MPDCDWILLPEQGWQETLASHCKSILAVQSRVVLSITGKAGSGKSTLGRELRKRGLPGIPKRWMAVIDDGVLFAPIFGIIPRRIKHRSKERDELAPFLPYLGKKKLLVYVNAHPEFRLSRCDILLRLECSEEIRRLRLVGREIGGDKRYLRTRDEADVDLPCLCRMVLNFSASPL